MDAKIVDFKGALALIDADRNLVKEGDTFYIFKDTEEQPSIGVGKIVQMKDDKIYASYKQSSSYSSNRMLNPIGKGFEIEIGDIAEF